MRKLIHLAVRLYPRQWLARYGPEFDALLEDVNPGFGDLLNIVKGALFMQFTRFSVPVTAAAFAAAGLLAAGLFSVTTPRQRTTTEQISIQADSPEAVRANVIMMAPDVTSDLALRTLIEMNGLYSNRFASPADRLHRFKQDLTIALARKDYKELEISFIYPDGQKAQKVTAALAQLIVDDNTALEEQRTADWGAHSAVRMRVASPPQQVPLRRNRIKVLALGLLGGALTGVAVALLRRLWSSQFVRSKAPVTVGVFALIGLLVAVVVSMAVPRRYRSTATFAVQSERPVVWRSFFLPLTDRVLGDEEITALIEQNALYANRLKHLSMADRVNRFKNDLTIRPLLHAPTSSFRAVEVSFTYPDGPKAQKVTTAVVTRFIEAGIASRASHPADERVGQQARIIDPPGQTPVGTDLVAKMSLGLGLGALAGIAIALLLRQSKPALAAQSS